MEERISSNIAIEEKTLKFSKDYSKVFLFNDNQCFDITLSNQTLNLQSFVNSNELILPSEATFKVGTKIDDTLIQIKGPHHTCTICSDLRIDSNKHTYLINIYADELNMIHLNIKRVYSGAEEVNLFDIYLDKHYLNISVESLKQNIVSEAGIVIFSTDCNIIPFVCSSTDNNKAHFKIKLSELISEKSNTFRGNLVFNNNIFPIRINKDIFFKEYITSSNGVINSLFISSSNSFLSIEARNTITFEPTLTEFSLVDNNLLLKGKFNSTLAINNPDLFEVDFKFFNNESSRQHKISYNETEFEVCVDKDDLFKLKNLFSKKIKLGIELRAKNEVLANISKDNTIFKPISFDYSYEHIGFERFEVKENLSQRFLAHVIDSSDSYVDIVLDNVLDNPAQVLIANTIKISEIRYIKAKKDSIEIKFRSARNLPMDNFNIEINSLSKKLIGSKIKRAGKKTFIATFKEAQSSSLKGDEVFLLLDEIITKGLKIETYIDSRVYSQDISDINELSVFKNAKDFNQTTKGYKKICSFAYEKLFLKLPIKKNRILFESFLGRNISGNPKYIYQYLIDNGLDEEFELIWILDDTSKNIEGKHKVVKKKSFKYYYFMATSGYWVFNSRQSKSIKKRDGIKYIQTWHGTPMKKLAGDMDFINRGKITDVDKYRNDFWNESAKWDYLLVQNNFSKEILPKALNFNKDIVEGYPANDILYTKNNKDYIDSLKNKLGLPNDKKVILYAPTWRDNQCFKPCHYKFNLKLELDKMQEKLGSEYVLILKPHYLITNAIDTDKYNGFVYNLSKGFDIQELYLVSDILITDYSSAMFDFANLKRPIIFFTYDLEEYKEELRGLYFNIEEIAPGPIVSTTDDAIEAVLDKNLQDNYKDKYDNFYKTFCHIDNGNSSKNVVENIFKATK